MVLLFLLPLAASLLLLVPSFGGGAVIREVLAHPQFAGAMQLTLFTGLTSTALSLIASVAILSAQQKTLLSRSSAFLALPHLALAIGLGFLIAPTGLLARLIATLLTGWSSPPDWQTTQDPYGLGLIIALVLKETPFLVWAFATVLQQDELRQRFERESAVARSLGHGPRSTFLRVLLPQVLSRSIWPIIAVLSYGMTVVDMALVIGPTQPPTYAQLVWTDLNDADPATNMRGAVGTTVLARALLAVLVVGWLAIKLFDRFGRSWFVRPATAEAGVTSGVKTLWPAWSALYLLVFVALLMQSVSGFWPFPSLLADNISFANWLRLFGNPAPLVNSLLLAVVSSGLGLAITLIWFETQSRKLDQLAMFAALLVLCLPTVLVALGEYKLLLRLQLTGEVLGLLLVHLLPVLAYQLVMLRGPWRAFDSRWQQAAAGLGASRLRFLMQVKVPMLKSALLSAFAVGFAVSVAQYVPAQLAAAGRFSTLPMEAVTLSSGGNRALIAASALMLMALPFVVFRLAIWFGKPRWETA
jgi:putative thiamine transport system permease protein